MITIVRKIFFILSCSLSTLLIVACSSTYQTNASNFSAEPLALAGKAFALLNIKDQEKQLISLDLQRAYLAAGDAKSVIELLQEEPLNYPEARDQDYGRLAFEALDEKPDLKTALALARAIKKPSIKSSALLHILNKSPVNKHLDLLPEVEKSVLAAKDDGFTTKVSNLLDLSKMYLELNKNQKAKKLILLSHPLLGRNPTEINAIYFGNAAKIEAQLGMPPQPLCKLTRFLHKTKHRPIALVNITKEYLAHGYQGDVCTTDEQLMALVKRVPIVWQRSPVFLDLAEAFHSKKDQEKATWALNEAIKTSQQIETHLKLRYQGQILLRLEKIGPVSLSKSFSETYWKQIDAISHDYSQSEILMQLASDAYSEGLPTLSLFILRKMKDASLKQTVALYLLKDANDKDDKKVAQQAAEELFSVLKLMGNHPYSADQKVDLLTSIIGSGLESGNTEIVVRAFKIAEQEVAKISSPLLKLTRALQLTAQAKKHKDHVLAQSLLKRTQAWYLKDFQQSHSSKGGGEIVDGKMDYKVRANNTILINIIKTNILLGRYNEALKLLDTFGTKRLQARSLTYAAIALFKKRLDYGVTTADSALMSGLRKRIKRIK